MSQPLDEVVSVARSIVERTVWATVATVGPEGEPRTRLLHPVWFWNEPAPVSLIATRPTPMKLAHIAAQPVISCFYWGEHHDTVAIDGTAEWILPENRSRAWEAIAALPEPVGFDPAIIWPDGPDSEDCAFLSVRAHRIVATPTGQPAARWRADR